jgi:integrase
MSPSISLKLLNNLSVSQLAKLSKLSKSYISQVKHRKCPPSQRLLESLSNSGIQPAKTRTNYLFRFLQSRQASEVSPGSLLFYRVKLSRFLNNLNADTATSGDIEEFLLQYHNPGNRHAYYRAIKTFYNWREGTFNLPNPMKKVKAPRLAKLILPSLTIEQVSILLDKVDQVRDKAIIALFTDSGLRLCELTNIKLQDIDWETRTIRVIGKGRKEALAPFGPLSQRYLREWLNQYVPVGNVWGLNQWGIISMLRRLRASTGLPCNPHTFRRTFATLLRRSGLDVMTIQNLGRWESLEMVQRYTRSVSFRDCLKFYKAPLS